ncbi:MAG: SH3 domain-containing protein [Oscillospiraceae bacterium]
MSNKSDNSLSPTVKGVIAILITLLVVIIVIMICAKLIFVGINKDDNVVTGKITSTQSMAVTTTTKVQHTTTYNFYLDEDEDSEDDEYGDSDDEDSEDDGNAETKTVISAVYLHPEPNSSSANLMVLPVGAKCKVFRNENGWLYLEYNGQKGYAYYTFFS